LADSIREIGVLQPVLVRPIPPAAGERDGVGAADVGEATEARFELIAGERRWRAARRAGLDTIPALVRQVEDLDSLEQALVENLHREDLNPLEEAAAYQQLIEDFGMTQEHVAARVGRSRSTVANTLRLFQLSAGIQRMVGERRLSAGHARALLGTPDRSFQESLAQRVCQEGLSVRQTEEAVRRRAELQAKLGPVVDATRADLSMVDDSMAGASLVDLSTAGGSMVGGSLAGRSPAGGSRGDQPTLGGSSLVEPDESTIEGGRPTPALRPLPPAGLLELQELLADYLDTRVGVVLGPARGRITIDFADLGDLERIYRLIADPRS